MIDRVARNPTRVEAEGIESYSLMKLRNHEAPRIPSLSLSLHEECITDTNPISCANKTFCDLITVVYRSDRLFTQTEEPNAPTCLSAPYQQNISAMICPFQSLTIDVSSQVGPQASHVDEDQFRVAIFYAAGSAPYCGRSYESRLNSGFHWDWFL